MPPPPPPPVWHLVRGLLRSLQTPPLSKELAAKAAAANATTQPQRVGRRSNAQTDYLIQQCRRSAASLQQSTPRLRLLQDYHRLRRDLAERATLQALDRGADQVLTPQEMSRRAAARAGLQLPNVDTTK